MITVGEVLKKQRKNLNKTLEQVAIDTKIQLRFLRYIEDDDFDKFDSPIFAQGFIKIYAKYLDLNEDRILAIYRRSVPNDDFDFLNVRETKKGRRKLRITPKLLTLTLSIIFLLGILGYIGFQIYQFQSPPEISISSPEENLSVTEEVVEVLGTTDTNSTLFVNDQPVDVDPNGNFQYQVNLNPGINLITILAKKNNSTQESIETIKVNYTVSQEQEEEVEDIVEEESVNTVKLEIVNSSVWVQFNVDKINKLSQIVQVGEEYEYEVKNQFSLTTGIINSTKLYFNEEEIPVSTGSSSVGSLTCEIINKDQINCQ